MFIRSPQLPFNWFGFVVILFALFVFAHLFGCATTSAPTTPTVPKYELTLSGLVDGITFQGVAVGNSTASHQMTIQSAINVDYFTVQSCHRSIQFSNIITYPWFNWGQDNRSFTWTYKQAPTIEDDGDCILRFCAFSKVVGSPPVACAIVDFHKDRDQIPIRNIFKGVNGDAHGTSICHTQVGLRERMQFPVGVVTAKQQVDSTGKTAPYWISGQCVGKFVDAGSTLFEYQVPENECSVLFMERTPPHRKAKLTVIPYDTAIYTGGS